MVNGLYSSNLLTISIHSYIHALMPDSYFTKCQPAHYELINMHSYTAGTATGINLGFSILLKDTST